MLNQHILYFLIKGFCQKAVEHIPNLDLSFFCVCVPACCICQMLMSVENRPPVVTRTAPTTPGVMNATAQQDTDSMQMDVAVTVCFAPR